MQNEIERRITQRLLKTIKGVFENLCERLELVVRKLSVIMHMLTRHNPHLEGESARKRRNNDEILVYLDYPIL